MMKATKVIKRSFLTGFIILMPIVMTILVVFFLVNLLTNPFMGVVEALIQQGILTGHAIPLLNRPEVIRLISRLVILLFLGVTTLFVGIFVRAYVGRAALRAGEALIDAIPLVNKIYLALREVVGTLLSDQEIAFSQAVLVPFPSDVAYCLGFLTGNHLEAIDKNRISVFVPAGPNPTLGFVMMYDRKDVVFLKMPVEDALKAVISCGVICPKIY